MSIDLDKVIGSCRDCSKPLGDSPPPYCAKCTTMEKRRVAYYKEASPYKKVWNTVDDEEKFLSEMAANNTLFVPSAADLAFRHTKTAHYLLAQARDAGRTNAERGREIFKDALFHVGMAKKFAAMNETILARSR